MIEFKIQWFPGHMTKARRMMETQLKLVDVVVEVLDARIPISSSNPLLMELIGNKPKIIGLNKIDLADAGKTEQYMQMFQRNNLPVVKLDSATGRGMKQLLELVKVAATPMLEKWKKKGLINKTIRVMIVGIPNVGKSSLINRLIGQAKVRTANKPGVTRGQQWLTIDKGTELLDTPGVLWPKFDDSRVGFSLAITGAIKDDVYDLEQAIKILLEFLREHYPTALTKKYNVEMASDEAVESILEKVAIKRGCIKSGGVPDVARVLPIILKDFRAAELGRVTIDLLK